MNRIFVATILLCTPYLQAASPFTHSAEEIQEIVNEREVWHTFHGPILAIELVSNGENGNRYRFKVRETKPILQPRQMVEGRSLEDGSVITPQTPKMVMVATGYREEDRYFEATVRPLTAGKGSVMPGPVSYTVEDVQDVTDAMLNKATPRMPLPQRIKRCLTLLTTGI